MSATYQAKSLGDIAAHFDRRGFDAAARADRTTGKAKLRLEAEARTWHVAANILQNTTLEAEP